MCLKTCGGHQDPPKSLFWRSPNSYNNVCGGTKRLREDLLFSLHLAVSVEYPLMEGLPDTQLDRQLHTISPEQCFIRQIINPIRFSRTLIQLGYEPLPPYRSLHPLILFGWTKPVFFYPNMFAYARYLFHKRGFWYVMTTGFQARFFYDLLTDACQFMNRRFLLEHSEDSLPLLTNVDTFVFADPSPAADENPHTKRWNGLVENIMEEASLWKFGIHLSGLLAMKAYEILLTQPFYVIMVRQMASFVGGEGGYNWFHQAVWSIYRESGLPGFVQGFWPRLFCESIRLILYFSACRFIRRHVLSLCDRENGLLVPLRTLLLIIITNCTYRYEVVTCMMAVRGSRLAAANEANTFSDWRSCRRALSESGQSNRGSMPFWRRHVQAKHLTALQTE
nr:unnamed protein product [Spirometra erinaceieuropaei]